MEITYFVHATTCDNEAGLATGWEDSRLSEKGRRQAQELQHEVANRFDIVISSDAGRAVETAVTAFTPLQIRQDWRLREINYGTLSQRPSQQVKQDLSRYITTPFPDGESYSDVAIRMQDFLQELQLNHAGKRIALVAHQAPQLALEVILNGKTWQQAFHDDWRNTHSWQPGWIYRLQ